MFQPVLPHNLIKFFVIGLFFLLVGCQETTDEPSVESTATAVLMSENSPAIATISPTATRTNPAPTATSVSQPPTPTPPSVVEETAAEPAEPQQDPTVEPTFTPLPLEPEETLNGIPLSQVIVLPDETITNMQSVFESGRAIGRDPRRFSKLGDSVIANIDFLSRFDQPSSYTLGPYETLQPAIDQFPGSWERYGVGIRIGLSAWGVFDPLWANKDWCEPNEIMLDCEIRLNNPSLLIIHLGTNDLNESFEQFLRKTVEETLNHGVIPILLTKADRYEGDDNRNNEIIRKAAADFQVPLVDFDIVAGTLPNRGLRDDNVHLNGPLAHDYSLDETFEYGHTVHNLAILMMIDRLWRDVIEPSGQS